MRLFSLCPNILIYLVQNNQFNAEYNHLYMLRKLDILVAFSLHCIDMHSSDLGKIYPFHLKNILSYT